MENRRVDRRSPGADDVVDPQRHPSAAPVERGDGRRRHPLRRRRLHRPARVARQPDLLRRQQAGRRDGQDRRSPLDGGRRPVQLEPGDRIDAERRRTAGEKRRVIGGLRPVGVPEDKTARRHRNAVGENLRSGGAGWRRQPGHERGGALRQRRRHQGVRAELQIRAAKPAALNEDGVGRLGRQPVVVACDLADVENEIVSGHRSARLCA